MPKTKEDLLYALADRIGGEQGSRMREALSKPVFQGLKSLEQVYTEVEFAIQLDKTERDFRLALAKASEVQLDRPATWGWSN